MNSACRSNGKGGSEQELSFYSFHGYWLCSLCYHGVTVWRACSRILDLPFYTEAILKIELWRRSKAHSNSHNQTCLFAAIPNGFGTSPLTPSARISALNIVGDLLRKVGVSALYWSISSSVLISLSSHPCKQIKDGCGPCWVHAVVSIVSLPNHPHLVFSM